MIYLFHIILWRIFSCRSSAKNDKLPLKDAEHQNKPFIFSMSSQFLNEFG